MSPLTGGAAVPGFRGQLRTDRDRAGADRHDNTTEPRWAAALGYVVNRGRAAGRGRVAAHGDNSPWPPLTTASAANPVVAAAAGILCWVRTDAAGGASANSRVATARTPPRSQASPPAHW